MLIMAHATPRHITANYNPMGVRTTSLNIQNTQKYKKKKCKATNAPIRPQPDGHAHAHALTHTQTN